MALAPAAEQRVPGVHCTALSTGVCVWNGCQFGENSHYTLYKKKRLISKAFKESYIFNEKKNSTGKKMAHRHEYVF